MVEMNNMYPCDYAMLEYPSCALILIPEMVCSPGACNETSTVTLKKNRALLLKRYLWILDPDLFLNGRIRKKETQKQKLRQKL